MCMGKGCIEKTKNILSEKSQQYLMNLRLKEGMEYSNLILDECKGILFHNQSGYCFTEKQLHDIKQVCSMMIGMEYQVQALEKYQQLLKNEGVQH